MVFLASKTADNDGEGDPPLQIHILQWKTDSAAAGGGGGWLSSVALFNIAAAVVLQQRTRCFCHVETRRNRSPMEAILGADHCHSILQGFAPLKIDFFVANPNTENALFSVDD